MIAPWECAHEPSVPVFFRRRAAVSSDESVDAAAPTTRAGNASLGLASDSVSVSAFFRIQSSSVSANSCAVAKRSFGSRLIARSMIQAKSGSSDGTWLSGDGASDSAILNIRSLNDSPSNGTRPVTDS